MTVIAMTREMGSMGRDVALQLAAALDLELVQHEIVDHVADKLHLASGDVNRFLEGKSSLLERWRIDQTGLSAYTVEEILEVAAKGDVVIRGWGATYALRKVPHVLCVRVCAPREFRVRVLMERIGLQDEEAAAREIERNDAAHARTMLHLFQADYTNPLLYDAVFNLGKLSVAECVAAIQVLTEQASFAETEQSRALLQDMILEAKVRSALKAHRATHDTGAYFDVSVEPGSGRITLRGIARDDDFTEAAKRVAASVPGVTHVDDQLSVPRHYTPS